MTEATAATEQVVELTQEQKEQKAAEAYRAQLGATAEVVERSTEPKARPDGVPEKFWDPEKGEVRVDDVLKSYAELEKAQADAAAKAAEEALTPEQKAAKESEAAALEASAAELAAHRDAMTQKLVNGEAFVDADYEPFIKRGFSREDVDTFAEGLKAIGELHRIRVYNAAGGEEAYNSMIEWARGAYTKAEADAFDRDLNSTDPAVSEAAMKGLVARYQLANGRGGRDVTAAAGAAAAAAAGYTSKAEMIADMQNPKYAKDPTFREAVARKVAAARRAGVDLSY